MTGERAHSVAGEPRDLLSSHGLGLGSRRTALVQLAMGGRLDRPREKGREMDAFDRQAA